MKDPYCPECGVVQDLHSTIYCGIIREQRATYERKLELHREMGRIWSRDVDELEALEKISDNIIAKLLNWVPACEARSEAERWLQRNGGATTEQSSEVEKPTPGEDA
jgi:hypothetical protein